MGRRHQDEAAEFNPFIDILTCLAGILILIIILVVLQAQDAKVLIPTPIMNSEIDMEPVYVEVDREGNLFPIPVVALNRMADEALKKIDLSVHGDSTKIFQELNKAKIENEHYRVDLNYTLMGSLVLFPREGAKGFSFGESLDVASDSWFAKLLATIDNEKQMLAFVVRSTDQSYLAFRKARSLAWLQDTRVAYEVLDNNEPIKFGLGGAVPLPQ